MLWLVQGLLAFVFLFAGGMKLVPPIEAMAGPVALPGLFLRFIGVAEVLGAIGLILPGALRIRPRLTPLAAAGLAIITIGATVITVMGGIVAPALVPLIVAVLSGTVASGRWRLTPDFGSSRRSSRAEAFRSGTRGQGGKSVLMPAPRIIGVDE